MSPPASDDVDRMEAPVADAPLTGSSVSVLAIRAVAVGPLPLGAIGVGMTRSAGPLPRPPHPRTQTSTLTIEQIRCVLRRVLLRSPDDTLKGHHRIKPARTVNSR